MLFLFLFCFVWGGNTEVLWLSYLPIPFSFGCFSDRVFDFLPLTIILLPLPSPTPHWLVCWDGVSNFVCTGLKPQSPYCSLLSDWYYRHEPLHPTFLFFIYIEWCGVSVTWELRRWMEVFWRNPVFLGSSRVPSATIISCKHHRNKAGSVWLRLAHWIVNKIQGLKAEWESIWTKLSS
jgi:hypothetical protein